MLDLEAGVQPVGDGVQEDGADDRGEEQQEDDATDPEEENAQGECKRGEENEDGAAAKFVFLIAQEVFRFWGAIAER